MNSRNNKTSKYLRDIKSVIKDSGAGSTDSDQQDNDAAQSKAIDISGTYLETIAHPFGTQYTESWQGHDIFNRPITVDINAEAGIPWRITLAPGTGDQCQKRHVFYAIVDEQAKSVSYVANDKDNEGVPTGTVELRNKTGSLVFNEPQKDGSTKIILNRPLRPPVVIDGVPQEMGSAGVYVVFYTYKNEERYIKITKTDDDRLLTKFSRLNDGTRITEYFDINTGGLLALRITYADGSLVRLQPVKSMAQIFWGYRINAKGKPVDDVTWYAELRKLQYQNLKTKEKRTEKFNFNPGDNAFPELIAGQLNPALGTFEYAGAHGEIIIESANGRIDVRTEDGSTHWRDPANANASSSLLANGEATVSNADGTMARLYSSNNLTLMTKEGFRMQVTSPDVVAQMEAMNTFTDRRDWAQLLLKFRTRPSKLKAFVAALSKLSTCDKVPPARLQALVNRLLHLVAFPADIYQGRIGTCNVTTIMREVAMTNSARVAELIFSALATGFVTGADGKTFAINTANTLSIDASGRDICCKAFQNIVLQMLTQMRLFDIYGDGRPRRVLYRDNASGKGEFVICGELFSLDNSDSGDTCSLTGAVPPPEIIEFPGIDDSYIRDLCTEVTGVKHVTREITTLEELRFFSKAARKRNGTVIVVVDGSKPPITNEDETPDQPPTPNHVISDIDVGDDDSVYFMNEWPVPFNHDTRATRVSGKSFMDNCLIEWSNFEKGAAPGLRARIIVAESAQATSGKRAKVKRAPKQPKSKG